MMNFDDLRVLVVDDHIGSKNTICMMLGQLGIKQIYTEDDGQKALAFLDKRGHQNIDLILCDWNMPGISGVELLRQVRSVDQFKIFVMITGRGDPGSIEEAKNSGVTGYILKPFTLGEMEKKITYFLNNGEAKI